MPEQRLAERDVFFTKNQNKQTEHDVWRAKQ